MTDALVPRKEISREEFLGAMMNWCFRFGCEVRLRNMAHNEPLQDPSSPWKMGEFHERQRDGSIVDLSHRVRHKVIEIPELIFSRDGRMVSISAARWEDLMRKFELEHRRIFMELAVPYFNPRSGS